MKKAAIYFLWQKIYNKIKVPYVRWLFWITFGPNVIMNEGDAAKD